MKSFVLKNLVDSNIAKTILALLGLIGTFITIYAFFEEKTVDLRFEILASTNVLDFNAEVSKLDVIYDSTNLKQSQENLRIYTIKVINVGKHHIIKEFYDINDPLGIAISSGEIIEKPQLIQASNSYLKRNVKVVDFRVTRLNFSQVILESEQHFTFKMLVLHRKDSIPTIIPLGKIAGQHKIVVINAFDVKQEESFWTKVFAGDIGVQIIRMLTYFLALVIIIIVIFLVLEVLENYWTAIKRKRLINDLKKSKTYQYTRMDEAIIARYLEHGAADFPKMEKIIANEESLNNAYINRLKEQQNRISKKINAGGEIAYLSSIDMALIDEMFSDGILLKENERLIINLTMKDRLTKFIKFLKEKDYYNF